ncbi:STAS domain-containing protein [Aphelenchoides besseyi]|nr:STAS domain-containing protein [Aphelenchoides besseyi]
MKLSPVINDLSISDDENLDGSLHPIENKRRSYWHNFESTTSTFKSFSSCRRVLKDRLPWLQWLPRYSPRRQLMGDLGPLMPNWPAFHRSMVSTRCALGRLFIRCLHLGLKVPCAFAIIQLMCGAAARDILEAYESINENGTVVESELDAATIVSTLTFFNGLIFFCFASLKLQFLTVHFSKPLTSGFLTAAALHLVAAQLGNFFGLKVKRTNRSGGFGRLFLDIFGIFLRMPKANWPTVAISVISLILLLSTKFLLDAPIGRLFKRKLMIPWELILVIVVTVIVFVFDLKENYGVRTVGLVPNGFPNLTPPRLDLFPVIFQHSLAISIVQIAVHISMAKVMCRRKGYHVDEQQEVWAMSVVHLVNGFFPTYPTTNGLGRASIIADDCGATSLLTSVFTGLILLAVTVSAGPLFSWIPLCVLAVIVLVSVRTSFNGLRDLPHFWRLSKWDGATWIITFLSSTCFNVIIGLAVGVGFQMLALSTRMQWPKWTGQESKFVSVFRFHSPLVFANAEEFKSAIHDVTRSWSSAEQKSERVFIFDCVALTTIDAVGVESFAEMIDELGTQFECTIFFVQLDEQIRASLRTLKVEIDDDFCLSTIREALKLAEHKTRGNHRGEAKRTETDIKTTVTHKLLETFANRLESAIAGDEWSSELYALDDDQFGRIEFYLRFDPPASKSSKSDCSLYVQLYNCGRELSLQMNCDVWLERIDGTTSPVKARALKFNGLDADGWESLLSESEMAVFRHAPTVFICCRLPFDVETVGVPSICDCSQRWTIESYAEKQKETGFKTLWKSRLIQMEQSGSAKFAIRMYPSGYLEECRDDCALFFSVEDLGRHSKLTIGHEVWLENEKQKRTPKLIANCVYSRPNYVGWTAFMSQSKLREFVGSGQLIVCYRIISFVQPISKRAFTTQHRAVARSYNVDRYADLEVRVGNEKFLVSKSIVCPQSTVLDAMFLHDTAERRTNVLNINDAEAKDVDKLLRFLYTGEVDDLRNSAHDLLPLADCYDVSELTEMCVDAMVRNLSPENCARYLRLSITCTHVDDFYERILDFCRANPTVLREDSELKKLISEYPEIIDHLQD